MPLRIAFTVFSLGLGFGLVGYYRWIEDAPLPGETFALATRLAPGALQFDSTGEVSWRSASDAARGWLVENAGPDHRYRSWESFLRPALPPLICRDPTSGAPLAGAPELARLVAGLEEARGRGEETTQLENDLVQSIRAFDADGSRSRQGFGDAYNRGVASLLADRPNLAFRFGADRLRAYDDTVRLPPRNRGAALVHARSLGVGQNEVLRSFLARYAAGLIHLARPGGTQEVDENGTPMSIILFRRAINAFYYMNPPSAIRNHAERVAVPRYLDWACDPAGAGDTLTSLDAYGGLIAAYLAAPEYRDWRGPAELLDELDRQRGELPGGDPFEPLIRYGQDEARGGSETIPEHFLWAVSNVQTVRRLNDVATSKRAEVARAVLALQLVAQPDWVAALSSGHGFESCRFLSAILTDLERVGRDLWSARVEELSRLDEALAGVSVYLAAAAEAECDDASPQMTGPARSGLLRAGAPLMADRLSGFYERRRERLESGIGRGFDPMWDSVRADLAAVRSGRSPGYVRMTLDHRASERFVREWRRAVFRDIAESLVRSGGPRGDRIPSDLEREYLIALTGAAQLSGSRPREIYPWSQIGPAAGALAGTFGERLWLQYHVRSLPGGTWVTLVAGAILGYGLLVWLHLLAWRWTLVAGGGYRRAKDKLERERALEAGSDSGVTA